MALKLDYWLFREPYEVVAALADAPEYTISRIGGGRFTVTDDLANHLGNFRHSVLRKYPSAAGIAIMKLAGEFDAILTRRSLGGDEFDEEFWTNEAFQLHADWQKIRQRARDFWLR